MLLTIDEARKEFVSSALLILKSVDGNIASLSSVIAGEPVLGTGDGLCQLTRDHLDLIRSIDEQGYGHAVRDEIEGLRSCLEALGV